MEYSFYIHFTNPETNRRNAEDIKQEYGMPQKIHKRIVPVQNFYDKNDDPAYNADMSRLIISDSGPWMRLRNIRPCLKIRFCFSTSVQKTWAENPALIGAAVDQLLYVQFLWTVNLHSSIPIKNTCFHISRTGTIDHAVSDNRSVILVPAVAVGIPIYRKNRLQARRHLR